MTTQIPASEVVFPEAPSSNHCAFWVTDKYITVAVTNAYEDRIYVMYDRRTGKSRITFNKWPTRANVGGSTICERKCDVGMYLRDLRDIGNISVAQSFDAMMVLYHPDVLAIQGHDADAEGLCLRGKVTFR
jgi:hypothetical protein